MDTIMLSAQERDQLAEPLIVAVRDTLKEMAGVEIGVRSVYRAKSVSAPGDLCAVVQLCHELHGALILSFSAATAAALARRVFAEVGADPDDILVSDCMGEIANVVAGQAKSLLAGTRYHFTFGTPTVFACADAPRLHADGDALIIAFDSDAGGFSLHLQRVTK